MGSALLLLLALLGPAAALAGYIEVCGGCGGGQGFPGDTRCTGGSSIPQAAPLDGSSVSLGCLRLFSWGRDLGILGTGAEATSFRCVQKLRRLLEDRSLEKNLG
ncbi:hypothetical protein Nmel_017426 [Mimus melanotis]